ncbi:MAG: GNAT family N-acetyltransferase [Rectinemataceae bacterium]
MTDSRAAAPPPYIFRKADAGDAAALVELRLAFMRIVKDCGLPDEKKWRSHLSMLFERDLAAGTLVCWICLEGGRVVAASGIAFDVPRDRRVEEALILNMYTVPERRRRGLASELLRLCVVEGRARGLRRLRLQPTDEGRALYESFGFRRAGGDMVLELA